MEVRQQPYLVAESREGWFLVQGTGVSVIRSELLRVLETEESFQAIIQVVLSGSGSTPDGSFRDRGVCPQQGFFPRQIAYDTVRG